MIHIRNYTLGSVGKLACCCIPGVWYDEVRSDLHIDLLQTGLMISVLVYLAAR